MGPLNTDGGVMRDEWGRVNLLKETHCTASIRTQFSRLPSRGAGAIKR